MLSNFFISTQYEIKFTFRYLTIYSSSKSHFRIDTLFLKILIYLLENPMRETWRDQTRMKLEQDLHKKITQPLTQNLKTLDLSVFFLICCSTFLFLSQYNIRLDSHLDT